MRRLGLALVLFAASAGVEAADFTRDPPTPIAGFVDWPSVAGEFQAGVMSFGYRFYVNPERPALYSVMRYRLRATAEGPAPTEKFMWVERPGQSGAPMRCFELRNASEGQAIGWREMTPGSREYAQELQTLRAVLVHQNREMHKQWPAIP